MSVCECLRVCESVCVCICVCKCLRGVRCLRVCGGEREERERVCGVFV